MSWIDVTSWVRTESLIVLSRNAAEVNSQGREPLETVTSMLLSRNAAEVIFHINHRHRVTRTIEENPGKQFRFAESVSLMTAEREGAKASQRAKNHRIFVVALPENA